MNTSMRAPAASASSAAHWMSGLSTIGSISFGLALVAGRKRVPRPAPGKTAQRIGAGRLGAGPAPPPRRDGDDDPGPAAGRAAPRALQSASGLRRLELQVRGVLV